MAWHVFGRNFLFKFLVAVVFVVVVVSSAFVSKVLGTQRNECAITAFIKIPRPRIRIRIFCLRLLRFQSLERQAKRVCPRFRDLVLAEV